VAPLPRDLQADVRGGAQQGGRAHASPGEDRSAPTVRMFEPGGQPFVNVAGLCFDQDPAARCQQLGAAAQEPGRAPADADIAVREQHGGPLALPGQRIEHRAEQGGCPGLPRSGHRGPGDVHAKRRDPPLGKRYGQPPGPAAYVEDRAAAVPE
jgi:hypothetical protein